MLITYQFSLLPFWTVQFFFLKLFQHLWRWEAQQLSKILLILFPFRKIDSNWGPKDHQSPEDKQTRALRKTAVRRVVESPALKRMSLTSMWRFSLSQALLSLGMADREDLEDKETSVKQQAVKNLENLMGWGTYTVLNHFKSKLINLFCSSEESVETTIT